jgi:FAD binding domain/Berberine and berberine like
MKTHDDQAGARPDSGLSSDKIGPDDPRYAALLQKRFNKRFSGKPDYVRLVGSTAQVVDALHEAVHNELRVVVRSGGHCLEGFVSDPAVRVVIDTSLMTGLHYDAQMGAFAVEAGVTLGEAYRKLFLGWGVTIPAGESPDIGFGGHVVGGAFGFLCRQHGLAADHLHAVEVVVADQTGTVRSVVATCEPSDPNRDLWWAHTGGGGGNFGIVTRYWLRTPGTGTTGTAPAQRLPPAPQDIVTFKAEWDWKQIDEAAFGKLVRNYGAWCEHNSAATSPASKLFSVLSFGRPPHGAIVARGVLAGAGGDAQRLLDEHLGAINQDVGVAHTRQVENSSWLSFALNPFPDLFAIGPGGVAGSRALFKIKDAFLRRRHTDRQIAVAYDYLTRKYPEIAGGAFNLATYGGQVNSVAPDATATAQRDAVMTTAYTVGWEKPEDQPQNLRWLRELYRDLFADTGGVPVPGESSDGALINHPDVDLADPEWNRSGVDWGTLYYKANYPRLQRVKAQWDPANVFRHALSIRGAK